MYFSSPGPAEWRGNGHREEHCHWECSLKCNWQRYSKHSEQYNAIRDIENEGPNYILVVVMCTCLIIVLCTCYESYSVRCWKVYCGWDLCCKHALPSIAQDNITVDIAIPLSVNKNAISSISSISCSWCQMPGYHSCITLCSPLWEVQENRPKHGRRNWSGCSGHGRTYFSRNCPTPFFCAERLHWCRSR